MTKVAEIYDAELNPSKQEVINQWLPDVRITGAYRMVDPAGEVGIEGIVATDADARTIQAPVTYRGASTGEEFTTLEHSVLGTRYVTKALQDPVAVGEFVRVILSGDTDAERSDNKPTSLHLQGTGQTPSAEVTDVVVEAASEERARGRAKINGVGRSFELRIPRQLKPLKGLSASRVPSPRRIEAHLPGSEEKLLVAELIWRDL